MSVPGHNVPRPTLVLPLPVDQREGRVFAELTRADAENLKRSGHVAIPLNQYLVLQSPDGTWWQVSVSNAGVLETTSRDHP